MKKIIFGLALTLGISAFAWKANQLEDLNLALAKLLEPLQNETTKASLVFHEIKTSDTHTLKLDVSALFYKKGSENTLNLQLQPITYDFGDGKTPTVDLKAALGLDLTKLISQTDFNALVPDLEKTIESLAKDLAKEYGDAVQVEAQISEKAVDTAGNYTGLKGSLSAKIDLEKLPEGKNPEDIFLTQGSLEIEVDLKTGASLGVKLILNPGYKGFTNEQNSMKAYLNRLLNQEPDLMDQLQTWMARLDFWSTDIVNQKAP